MAPDLASFTASPDGGGEPPGTGHDVVAAVLAALGQGFTIVPDRTAPRAAERRIWFDTFDWRLFKAGLLLEYVPGRHGSELRLTAAETPAGAHAITGISLEPRIRTSIGPQAVIGTRITAGAQPLTATVTGWQPSRPHLASDLPPGALADRVGRLIAPRALLPVAAVTQTAAASRLLNADDKTVARLVIERPVLATQRSSEAQRDVGPRFVIQPVRGYPGQARRAVRLLAETGAVAPAGGTVLADALAALGRVPGDYSNKVDAPVTAGMPGSQAVAVILLRLLDAMEANVHGVLRDIDPEFLHDFRVAVRRTRAALKLFGPALITATKTASSGKLITATNAITASCLEHAAAEFKWLGDLTTPTRDLDVHLLGFDDMAAGLRAAKPDDLEPFRAYLRERRARECRALARGLRSARFRELTGQWRTALTPLSERRKPARGTNVRSEERSAAVLAAERTRRAFAKVAKGGAAITPDSPHESLHDLRKRCKELRYALEFFAPLHDRDAYTAVLSDLKKLQDCLGDFQDNEVQIAEIRSLATAMQAAGEGPAVTLLAMGEITAGLAKNQASARADFERRFAAFAGADGQRRMSVLLRGGVLCGFTRRTTSRAAWGRRPRRSTWPTCRRPTGCARCCGTWTRRARPATCSGSSRG